MTVIHAAGDRVARAVRLIADGFAGIVAISRRPCRRVDRSAVRSMLFRWHPNATREWSNSSAIGDNRR